ncbi:MAG: hypothetical protein CTY20_05150 [Hyphomicrobium sp.]|nr:MAG: hypothetical protein CTY20_05150 [Hyphomicrobium sp.]
MAWTGRTAATGMDWAASAFASALGFGAVTEFISAGAALSAIVGSIAAAHAITPSDTHFKRHIATSNIELHQHLDNIFTFCSCHVLFGERWNLRHQ